MKQRQNFTKWKSCITLNKNQTNLTLVKGQLSNLLHLAKLTLIINSSLFFSSVFFLLIKK